jgi:hypothetical protein
MGLQYQVSNDSRTYEAAAPVTKTRMSLLLVITGVITGD